MSCLPKDFLKVQHFGKLTSFQRFDGTHDYIMILMLHLSKLLVHASEFKMAALNEIKSIVV